MIDRSHVSAALVTRGDVDLSEILASIADAGITDVHVWDNSKRERDFKCFGRFAVIHECRNEIIYTQDDDLIAPVERLLQEYQPNIDSDVIVANKPEHEEWRFLGCGAVFRRGLVRFAPYTNAYGFDDDFFRVADVVFAYQRHYESVDLGHRNLPWGYHTPENPRMYGAPDHIAVRERARDRTLALAGVTA